jgi:hypothetical protein
LVEELLAMVNWPVTAPATVGSNWTFRVTVWVGFNVIGNVTPDTEKPGPATVAELMVTGAVPVEVRIRGLVDVVFSATLPNAMVVALIPRVGVAAFNCRAKLAVTVPTLAVSVTACAVVTAETAAANLAVVALAGTVIVAGTATAVLLLERFTLRPPVGAGPVSVTLQASVPAPVKDEVLQKRVLKVPAETPVPLSEMFAVLLVDELLTMVN